MKYPLAALLLAVASLAQAADAKPKAKAEGNWLAQLRTELKVCEAKSFFPREACREKARWKYCRDHWDAVPECKVHPGQGAPGSSTTP